MEHSRDARGGNQRHELVELGLICLTLGVHAVGTEVLKLNNNIRARIARARLGKEVSAPNAIDYETDHQDEETYLDTE